MRSGRYILTGSLELQSPLALGSGQDNQTDQDILHKPNGEYYLPATTLAGVLRHQLLSDEMNQVETKLWNIFWGQDNSDGRGSRITFYDAEAEPETIKISIRDGIQINSQTGLVENAQKYDYEVIERNAKFKLNLRIQYQDNEEQQFAQRLLMSIQQALQSGQLHLGAKTNNGLGQVKLLSDKLYHFDFRKRSHVKAWLSGAPVQKDYQISFPAEDYEIQTDNNFKIELLAQLNSSLMVRGYPSGLSGARLPDDRMLHSADAPVLPGSSFKGALRKRAERILNTLNLPVEALHKLFGFAPEDDSSAPKQRAYKGRLKVQETLLKHFELLQQSRIRIDRFTGGTISSALFQTMPIFAIQEPDKEHLQLSITVQNCSDAEAGLLMLLLKDLWTGDLALGGEKGVGRGRLKGLKATITGKGQSICFQDPTQLLTEEQMVLQDWVKALNTQGEKAA